MGDGAAAAVVGGGGEGRGLSHVGGCGQGLENRVGPEDVVDGTQVWGSPVKGCCVQKGARHKMDVGVAGPADQMSDDDKMMSGAWREEM